MLSGCGIRGSAVSVPQCWRCSMCPVLCSNARAQGTCLQPLSPRMRLSAASLGTHSSVGVTGKWLRIIVRPALSLEAVCRAGMAVLKARICP